MTFKTLIQALDYADSTGKSMVIKTVKNGFKVIENNTVIPEWVPVFQANWAAQAK